jgi:uncharacterized protein YndB with AHSA1/START domain
MAMDKKMKAAGKKLSGKELKLERVIDAPMGLLFRAWIDPRYVAQWWGPKMFDNPVCALDARPGGNILIHMRGPDGIVNPMEGRYIEISEPKKLVFTANAVDDKGGKPFIESKVTVLFAAEGLKTRMAVHAVVEKARPEAAPMLAGMKEGWSQSLEKLAELMGRESKYVMHAVQSHPPRQLHKHMLRGRGG